MKKKKKTVEDFLLETYKKTGLSRRRFLKRIVLQITGAGAIIAALAKDSKGCGCGGCNSSCNSACNASCDTNTCEESNSCLDVNVCNFNACDENTCHLGNSCTDNRCETANVCTKDSCDFDTCPGKEDTCSTNTCRAANPCNVNICEADDLCLLSNVCQSADLDCPNNDISCPLLNSCVNE